MVHEVLLRKAEASADSHEAEISALGDGWPGGGTFVIVMNEKRDGSAPSRSR